jgi:hypothetical protein
VGIWEFVHPAIKATTTALFGINGKDGSDRDDTSPSHQRLDFLIYGRTAVVLPAPDEIPNHGKENYSARYYHGIIHALCINRCRGRSDAPEDHKDHVGAGIRIVDDAEYPWN